MSIPKKFFIVLAFKRTLLKHFERERTAWFTCYHSSFLKSYYITNSIGLPYI